MHIDINVSRGHTVHNVCHVKSPRALQALRTGANSNRVGSFRLQQGHYWYLDKVSVIAVLTPPRWICSSGAPRNKPKRVLRASGKRRDAQKQSPSGECRPTPLSKSSIYSLGLNIDQTSDPHREKGERETRDRNN